MKRLFIKLVLILSVLYAILFVSCGQPLSYWSLFMRGQEYYAGIADDCEVLLAKLPLQGETEHRIHGADPILPKRIRDFDRSLTIVTENAVLVIVGNGWRSYKVSWGSNNENPSIRRLIVSVEGSYKVVYTRKAVK